ncbi:MAG: error-prone DNA polymerase [Pseudomonadales bacterium]
MATSANTRAANTSAANTSAAKAEFAELHVLSNYSFLHSAAHPEELVQEAARLGYRAIAITDECSLAGVVKANVALHELQQAEVDGVETSPGPPRHGRRNRPALKLIVGASFKLTDDSDQTLGTLVLLAPNRSGYGQLSALISRLRRRSPKGSYYLQPQDLRWGLSHCLALWAPQAAAIDTLVATGALLQGYFQRFWIALELFREADDLDKTAKALTLSMRLGAPIVAANDVRMHHSARQPLFEVLSAVRNKTTVAQLGREVPQNTERRLRSIAELQMLYPPETLAESVRIATDCSFSLNELRYEYPEELVPPHLNASQFLRQLTYAGAAERFPQGIPEQVTQLLEKELTLIAELRYEHFFLTVQDIVAFARSQQILCQGRGSAANSAVCYCLHITEVDPSRLSVLFERFVSKERNEPPDIDVDFEHERREEVIQYLYRRYSRDRAALAATLITYRPKSAVRDVGKALGLDAGLIDVLAKSLAWWDNKAELGVRLAAAGLDPDSQLARQFLYLVNEILGFPRHLSQHVGGFVISQGPLAQLVPVENASMKDRTVIQWDKDDLEALGLLKVDVLGLGMLTAIRKSLALINEHGRPEHRALSLSSVPPEDSETYAMLQQGDSIGVFQVESRAQMSMLPRLRPACFYDLVVQVAIVRPGPIQGDMVHPYLRRRQGLEPVDYPSAAVEKVLSRTLGIPIFQEQVIELAMVAAGFSAGEADQLRRAMAAWKRKGGLMPFEDKLINGMLARGHDRDFAERVFRQIQGFGDYGFPESHAASFALLVYISAWIKCHEPAAFYCGLLNSLPMGFYSPSQLVQDARRHGIEVLPVDVQHSHWDHRLEPNAAGQHSLQLGLRLVKGLDEATANAIVAHAPYRSSEQLLRNARLNRQKSEFLARAGALRSLSGHRHQAHWDIAGTPEALPMVKDHGPAQPELPAPATELQAPAVELPTPALELPAPAVELPAPASGEEVLADYRYLSLSLGPHPMHLLRSRLPGRATTRAVDLQQVRHGQLIRVAGLVTGRQRPGTATGVLFVTLEDDTENINVVVWARVLENYRAALLQGQLLLIRGTVEREANIIHVIAGVVEDHSHLLEQLSSSADRASFRSRDFH